MTTVELDQEKLQAFGGQVQNILTGAALTSMMSIGHQTGLFDAMAALPPSTSDQIADAAGLNERYVREWLASMTTGRIVEYEPAAATYHLPPEHAAMLTRAAGPRNFAVIAQVVPKFAPTEAEIVRCFREGGGVPYSAFGGFQRLMAEMSGMRQDAVLVQTILPAVPGLVERLEAGIDVADIGCGTGHAINLMARAYPRSRFTGYDIAEEGVALGRDEAARLDLTNARFVQRDVADLAETAAYDFITAFDAIHDQAHPRRVLAGIARALRPGGVFLMVDIAASSHLHENMEHPMAAWFYAGSTLHCMTVSLAEGGEGLGTMWGEQKARELLAEAGFTDVTVQQIEGDIVNNYYVATK